MNRIKTIMLLVMMLTPWLGSMEGVTQPVTFDRLLPLTSYNHLYELCMRTWYGMRQCESYPSIQRDAQDLQDCLLGKLVRMKASIKQLPADQNREHAGYLLMLLQHIEGEQQGYLAADGLAQVALRKSEHHLVNLLQKPISAQ